MYSTVEVNQPGDLAKLESVLPEEFNPKHVVEFLDGMLSPAVRVLVVEYPYVDKDYRSTYYAFYAKKGLKYDHFCVRLHFFGEGVSLTPNLELQCIGATPAKRYHGYMVLRPTHITPIGRTVLSPQSRNGHDGATIQANHHVHLLGEKLSVEGFPYMEQHTDVSVCAHAACWSILRHYSQKHGKYAEFLIHDVTRMAASSDPGGLVPSRGMHIEQACQVFFRAGLYPDVYLKEDAADGQFFRILHAYVESGFPVFAAMFRKATNDDAHAVAVIGHGKPMRDQMRGLPPPLFSWDCINSLIVMDDNLFPYQQIDALSATPYPLSDIDAFVVALPEKVYFSAETVELRVLQVLQVGVDGLDLSYLGQPVIRYVVTTAARLRSYLLSEKSAIPPDLYCALMELALPQFVWMVQLSTIADWESNRCTAFILIDATASAFDEFPFILLHDRKSAILYDRGLEGEIWSIDFGATQTTSPGEFKNPLCYRH